MTEENFIYRTSPFLLRNQFNGTGKWGIPLVPKAELSDDAFIDLRLIGFDRTNLENNSHLDRMVHFFLYDYKFERVWKNPDTDLERLKRYRAVLTPDFSMYLEMAQVIQLYNTFRNRWCGAYWASKGMQVIPTVNWGAENTFAFCFEGIPKGSTVAVSTYMVSAHGNHGDQKEFFLKGYSELLRRIEPERIICYNEPFPEMEGNLIYVNYELSSWKYQNHDDQQSKFYPYLCGEKPLPKDSRLLIKSGYVIQDKDSFKGTGSAFGGRWRPSKPDDERLLGQPGEIIVSYKKDGTKIETKIGDDGRATKERHHTDKPNPKYHTNPHDHTIDWTDGFPKFSHQINYPDGAPEFKAYGGIQKMGTLFERNSMEDNRFQSIGDFKWCVDCGGEVVFIWKDKTYGITPKLKKSPDSPTQMLISQIEVENMEQTEKWCDTADELLEYTVDGDRLRDIITKVHVLDRTI
ncbi:DUF4417 domain-containing protein [Candidatus Soleaferrea massiliensis]|uniref:DUF4417 domain-containing protein n=1 Tax=Candidatus Soleaferrea massiliensis TaxID=1470354 RepID=UPI0006950357|nr:DUF4417 domain-containing protein [Candidatus Soleaferrea massiliensis]